MGCDHIEVLHIDVQISNCDVQIFDIDVSSFHIDVQISNCDVQIFLIDVQTFLIDVQIFLIDVSIFLIDVSVFLIDVSVLLIDVSIFLIDVGILHIAVSIDDIEVGIRHIAVSIHDIEVGILHIAVSIHDIEVEFFHTDVSNRGLGVRIARMKRGCFVTLLILVALIGGYWYLLHGHVEPPVLWWSVGIASFFMWISTGALRTAAMAARDASRVSSQSSFAGFSGEEMTDGETVTIVGRVRALGSPLRAPFSDQPAVLYSYEIEHISQDRESTSTAKDYSGFALAPTAINSSRGSINLLGFPLLEGFPKTTLDTDAARQNAAAYIASTPFTDMQGFHPGQIYQQIRDVLTDDDGHLRKDWKMTEDRDLSDKTLKEQIVAPGEQVCVIGSWSAAKHGLVPGGTDGVIQLLRGDPQKVESGLWGKCIRNVIGGLVVAAIVNAGVYALLRAAAGDPRFSFLSQTIFGRSDKIEPPRH